MEGKTSRRLFPKSLSIAKVIAPFEFKRDIVRAIEDLEKVQPISVDPRVGADQLEIEDRRVVVEGYRTKLNSFLSSIDTKLIPETQHEVGSSEEDVLKHLKEVTEVKGKQINEIVTRRDSIASRKNELEGTIRLLQSLTTLNVDSGILADTRLTHTYLGTVFPPQVQRILWFKTTSIPDYS